MFPRAAEFLKPTHVLGKLCGIFPLESLSDETVSRVYQLFCFLLLATVLKPIYELLVVQYRIHNDIICLTVMLHVIFYFLCHAVTIIVPLQFRKTYLKLFKKLGRVEGLLHSVNVKQTECPNKFRQCVWIGLALLIEMFIVLLTYSDRIPIIIVYGVFICYSSFNAFIIQLTSILTVVENKFLLINWHLDYLNNKFPPFLLPPENTIFIQKKIYAKHVKNKFVNPNLNKRSVSFCNVKSFNLIHYHLYSCCNLINEYFSLQILANVLRVSLQIINSSLLVFSPRPASIFARFIFVGVTFYNCSWVFCISDLCHKITSEVST